MTHSWPHPPQPHNCIPFGLSGAWCSSWQRCDPPRSNRGQRWRLPRPSRTAMGSRCRSMWPGPSHLRLGDEGFLRSIHGKTMGYTARFSHQIEGLPVDFPKGFITTKDAYRDINHKDMSRMVGPLVRSCAGQCLRGTSLASIAAMDVP